MGPAHGAEHFPNEHDETVTIKTIVVHDDDDDLYGLLCVDFQMKKGLDWSSDFEKDNRRPWTCVEACHHQYHPLTMTPTDAKAFPRTISCAVLDDVVVDIRKNNPDLDLLMSSCWTNRHENDAMMMTMPSVGYHRFHDG